MTAEPLLPSVGSRSQWRLMLPYVCALPPPVAIVISYVLSWFSGYWFDAEPTFHQDEARHRTIPHQLHRPHHPPYHLPYQLSYRTPEWSPMPIIVSLRKLARYPLATRKPPRCSCAMHSRQEKLSQRSMAALATALASDTAGVTGMCRCWAFSRTS